MSTSLHAVSDPHDPPGAINDRPRDVVDLLLLRDLVAATGSPTLSEIRDAGVAVFEARANDAVALGLAPRVWPPNVVAHRHWAEDFARAASSGGIALALDAAVAKLNDWIALIAGS